MVTNYPQAMAAPRQLASEAHQEGVSVFERLRQIMCGLHGHDALVQFEQDRMFLRCVSCGHETHGWELNEPRPHVTVREAPRAPLARPHFVTERKIA
jgi:hypothetical protein